MDLTTWQFDRHGPVLLDGQWEFYWRRYIPPQDFHSSGDLPPKLTIRVPGIWNGIKRHGQKLPGTGFATYRLTVEIADSNPPLAFKLLDMATAFDLYLNGRLLFRCGQPGQTRTATTPRFEPRVIPFETTGSRLEVVVHVANFHHRLGGIWEEIQLGTLDDMRASRRGHRNLIFFLIGSIFIMGVYHFALFFLRREDRSPLYFGIFCTLIGIRVLVTGERFILGMWPGIDWETLTRTDYISFYLAIPVFTLFTSALFPKETSPRAVKIICAFAICFSVLVLFTPCRIYSHSMPAFQLFTFAAFIYGVIVLMQARKHQREGSIPFLIGFVFLFIAALNDIFYSRQLIPGYYLPAGLLLFIFFQAFLISHRFSKAFGTVRRQQRELTRSNRALTREITERELTEEALKESEQKYRSLFEQSLEPMSISHQGRFLDANPAWMKLHGVTAKAEVEGRPVMDFICPEDHAILEARRKQWPHLENRVFELRDLHQDGRLIDVEVYSSAISYSGKQAILATLHDISAIKRQADAKLQLEARLKRAEKMEMIGTLAGGVAHDLNNILSGLVSYPELLLLDTPDQSPFKEPLVTIKKSGEKAAAIVQDLLTLARRGVVNNEVVQLNRLIDEYLDSPEQRKLQSRYPNVFTDTRLDPDLLNLSGSPVHLSKTLMNLVTNAAEAMPDGGIIRISTENRYVDRTFKGYDQVAKGDYVMLQVADTGTGIAPENRERIFEPFYTNKQMGFSGTGLGMAVVWGTVKDHQGYIDIGSDEGWGAVFKLYFPVTRRTIAADGDHFPQSVAQGNGEKILVVDDEQDQCRLAVAVLEKIGYSAVAVGSGEEALALISDRPTTLPPFDLLILDMIMEPGLNGLETYKRVQELLPGQKAIISSGYSDSKDIREALALGVAEYVKKPYTLEKMSQSVKRVLAA